MVGDSIINLSSLQNRLQNTQRSNERTKPRKYVDVLTINSMVIQECDKLGFFLF